jgi:arginase
VSARALRQADAKTLDDALEELSREVDAVYVHIDLDVIDPSVARANALSVEGGFDAGALEQALTSIGSRFEIAAAAMTAYDPSVDPEGRVPPIAATLAQQLVPERVAG